MMGAIGVTVGLIGYLLFLAIGFLEVRSSPSRLPQALTHATLLLTCAHPHVGPPCSHLAAPIARRTSNITARTGCCAMLASL